MKHLKWVLGVVFCIVLGVALFGQANKNKKALSVLEAQERIEKDSSVLVLDVRTSEEYAGDLGHIDHALLIPVQELQERIGELAPYKSRTILAVCRTGRRSETATELLTKNGFTVMNVKGGMVEWNEMRFPVVRVSK